LRLEGDSPHLQEISEKRKKEGGPSGRCNGLTESV